MTVMVLHEVISIMSKSLETIVGSKRRGQEVDHLSSGVPTVLVVDDDDDNIFFVSHVLSIQGIRSLSARTGAEAVEHLEKVQPDLLLLDIVLPDFDGFRVVELIHSQNIPFSFPIVAMTAFSEPGLVDLLAKKGFTDYLAKPFTIEDLEQIVVQCLFPIHCRDASE